MLKKEYLTAMEGSGCGYTVGEVIDWLSEFPRKDLFILECYNEDDLLTEYAGDLMDVTKIESDAVIMRVIARPKHETDD